MGSGQRPLEVDDSCQRLGALRDGELEAVEDLVEVLRGTRGGGAADDEKIEKLPSRQAGWLLIRRDRRGRWGRLARQIDQQDRWSAEPVRLEGASGPGPKGESLSAALNGTVNGHVKRNFDVLLALGQRQAAFVGVDPSSRPYPEEVLGDHHVDQVGKHLGRSVAAQVLKLVAR